jgi:hypothetical protein
MVSLYMDPTALDVMDDYFADLTDVIERGLVGDVSQTMAGFYGGL